MIERVVIIHAKLPSFPKILSSFQVNIEARSAIDILKSKSGMVTNPVFKYYSTISTFSAVFVNCT